MEDEMGRRRSVIDINFVTVIEADHDYLTGLAVRIRRLLEDSRSEDGNGDNDDELLSLLEEMTWRLIRHDVSEELVMRPAFVRYMRGCEDDEGAKMASDDRMEHQRIKETLMGLWARLRIVPGMDDGATGVTTRELVERELIPLLGEMREHMKVESRVELPRFAALVGEEVCLRLGKLYTDTLVLGLDLEVPVSIDDEGVDVSIQVHEHKARTQYSNSYGSGRVKRRKCFEGGLEEYMTTSMDWFRDLWNVLSGVGHTGGQDDYLSRRIDRELTILGVRRKPSSQSVSPDGKAKSRLKTKL